MEERGQYITLLCLQHQKGHLTEKMIRLCCGNAAADVMAKFRQDSAGLWYNVRLEQEMEKRREHSRKQSERAAEGWKKRKKQISVASHGNAAALPLENEDVNENELKNKKESNIDFTQPDIPGDTVVFPFDTELMRKLWAAWKEARWNTHKVRYPMSGEQADLRRLQNMTFQQVEETIQAAIAGGWKNLYPERNGKPKSKSSRDADRLASIAAGMAKRYGSDAGNQ